MFGDTGGPAAVVSDAGNRNRRGGRIPVRGMRTNLPVEFRADRIGINAFLMLAFLSIRLPAARLVPIPSGNRHLGRARHSVRAAIVVRTSGGQRTARPTEVCFGCH
jgi:hypothetical protein